MAQITITAVTIHVSVVSGSDVMIKHAINTPMTPKIVSTSDVARLYFPSFTNLIPADGIRNAQEPIMIGNATSALIPRRSTSAIQGA